ncbi:MAG: alpha/beta hydrolase [Ignavibacteria bacterium]|nr:alpha/beta hydrolase [Ignavibacteria bacterium]
MKNKIINGLSVYDNENGKPPLVFVHAFPLNAAMWKRQAEFFKKDFRVITYDVRGIGGSIPADGQQTMDFFAGDLISIIENLGITKINAAGLSMGGYIIQHAMLKRPELFNTIILADTKGERDTDEALISRADTIRMIKEGKRKEFSDANIKKLLNDKNYSTSLKTELEEIISMNTDEGICGSVLALATRGNYIHGLQKSDVNALILVGRDDILTPLPNSETLKNSLGNSEMHVIENSGHLTNMENPDEFNKLTMNFLMKHNK